MTQTAETVPAYQAPVFNDDVMVHGFFGRRGGVSDGVYASLNCAYGSHDPLERVMENRGRVAESLGIARDHLVSAYQVHSARCHTIDAAPADRHARPEGDALVTDRPGLALAVSTADCVPVLLYARRHDRDRPVVGAAHAGWAGALHGILEATCTTMISYGIEKASIIAATGPAIRQSSYAVSPGFETPFIEEDKYAAHFFKNGGQAEDKLFFDLPGYVAYRLSRHGIRHIHISPHDTYEREDAYFSHRRAVYNGEARFGCQLSAIAVPNAE